MTLILETLIVWTEPDGVDYALSFQEAEGCAEVWNFISEVQQHMKASGKYCVFVPFRTSADIRLQRITDLVQCPGPAQTLTSWQRRNSVEASLNRE